MLLAMSRFHVPSERQAHLEERFRARKRLVDGHSGFQRVQLVKARGTDEYVLLVEFADLASFQAYAKHPDFHHAHDDLDGDITPAGLRMYEVVLDSARGG